MGRKTESGFTIIEVMLFLTVSAMLLVGILVATGRAIADARFTDTLKGTESFMQRQYEEVVNGVNTRTNTQGCGSVVSEPGTGSCLLLGKAITFQQNSNEVKTFIVTGNLNGVDVTGLDTGSALAAITLSNSSTSQERYELPWGARFVQGKRTQAPTAANTVAYLRNPGSSQVETYVFSGTLNGARDSISNLESVISNTSTRNAATNNAVSFCVNSGDGVVSEYLGAIRLSAGQGAATVSSARLVASQWSMEC